MRLHTQVKENCLTVFIMTLLISLSENENKHDLKTGKDLKITIS